MANVTQFKVIINVCLIIITKLDVPMIRSYLTSIQSDLLLDIQFLSVYRSFSVAKHTVVRTRLQ